MWFKLAAAYVIIGGMFGGAVYDHRAKKDHPRMAEVLTGVLFGVPAMAVALIDFSGERFAAMAEHRK